MKRYVLTPSIISFKYKNGIITATDTHGSYGSMAMFDSLTRTFKLNTNTMISYTGEYSEITKLHKLLRYEILKDGIDIESQMDAKGIHKILQRFLYTRRSQMKPLNVSANVMGIVKKEKQIVGDFCPSHILINSGNDEKTLFLGNVNCKGNFFYSDVICTGLGAYIATPFLRGRVEGRVDQIERNEAIEIVKEAIKLMIYRDCYAMNKVQIGFVEDGVCEVSEPQKIDTCWEIGRHTYEE